MDQYTNLSQIAPVVGSIGFQSILVEHIRVQWPIKNNSSGIYAYKSVFKYPFSKSVSSCIGMGWHWVHPRSLVVIFFFSELTKGARGDAIYSFVSSIHSLNHGWSMSSHPLCHCFLNWTAIYSISYCNIHSKEMMWSVCNSFREKSFH